MKNTARILLPLALVTLFSCAHHRDVRPGADGLHTVVVRATEKEYADRSAISQAKHYCEQFKKYPGFVEEKQQYTGNMDEETRETLKRASAAAIILGGTGVATNDRGVRTAGGVLGAAGTAGTVMTSGEDYESMMRFKCQ